MSGIIDWSGPQGIAIRNKLIGYWLARVGPLPESTPEIEKTLERMKDEWQQKTCLGCGSATQPCCGH